MSSTSPSDSDVGSEDPEGHRNSINVLEKQESSGSLSRARTRDSNIQALPGVQLDEAELDDHVEHTEAGKESDEPRQSQGGRTGVAGVLERVISRTSTKSTWNPGPPPDGGVQAWMAGEFFAAQAVKLMDLVAHTLSHSCCWASCHYEHLVRIPPTPLENARLITNSGDTLTPSASSKPTTPRISPSRLPLSPGSGPFKSSSSSSSAPSPAASQMPAISGPSSSSARPFRWSESSPPASAQPTGSYFWRRASAWDLAMGVSSVQPSQLSRHTLARNGVWLSA